MSAGPQIGWWERRWPSARGLLSIDIKRAFLSVPATDFRANARAAAVDGDVDRGQSVSKAHAGRRPHVLPLGCTATP
jgi:hypothetical protein